MRRQLDCSRQVFSFLGCAILVALTCFSASAQNSGGDNFVYVMSNKNPGNSIIQFRRSATGSLTWVREVPTGGGGTGANGADPLGSQDSVVLSGDGQLLLAVNAGSDEVSVLSTRNGQLNWLSKASSGGTFPNSVTLSGDLVYVLNAGSSSVTGFQLDTHGVLHWITTVNLPTGVVRPNDIRFSPDGSHIFLTASGSNQILVSEVGDNGVAGVPSAQVSAGGSPFGIRFGHDGTVIISEAAGSASSYSLNDGTLNVISAALSNTQKASCWISVNRSAKEAYVSNTGSGTISSYQIGGDGSLTLLAAVAGNPGGAPIDSSLSRDSRFLYVVDSTQGKTLVFQTSPTGLVSLGSVSVPLGSQGVAAQ